MLLLAVENSDTFHYLFESNLANWVILVVLLVLLWNKFMPGVFAGRKRSIEDSLNNAKAASQEGEKYLADQKVRIANAEAEAKTILDEARNVAEQMKKQIAEQSEKDAVDLAKKLEQQIAGQRQMAIAELRATVALNSVRLAEAGLPHNITDSVKKGLEAQFISQMDMIGAQK